MARKQYVVTVDRDDDCEDSEAENFIKHAINHHRAYFAERCSDFTAPVQLVISVDCLYEEAKPKD